MRIELTKLPARKNIMMKKIIFLFLPFFAVAATAQTNNETAVKYANLITQEALKEKLSVIASAEMEGRETASPGQKRAAAYIESLFKKFGLKPGNGDSYQQYYPVFQDEITAKKLQVNGRVFEWDRDYAFSLNDISNIDATYPSIVFAGYGLEDSKNQVNDYANLDVKNKVVVVLEGTSTGSPATNYSKINAARKSGAAAVLIVTTDFPKKNATVYKGGMYLKRAGAAGFLAGTISEEVASALLGRATKQSFKELKEIAKGNYVVELKLTINKTTEELQSSNVLGVLPGTDKADEYVFLTGHYDHLGKRGDVIWYGADDDGSGTTSVLQMAEAFSAAAKKGIKPRRTIVFMTVSGEEKGLWGSQFYSEHPIYSLEKTSVDLNTDMVGRTDTERKTADSLNYIYVIGHDKLSSELAIINEAANNQYIKMTLDYKFDDPKDRERIYYRSDHYNFARKGVPILFFYDGMLLADYHKPTDTVDKINFELMEKRVKLVFYTAWEMANRNAMLKRDTPLNMPSTR